jgi:hypothetical protein
MGRALLLIGPNLVVQQVDQSPRDAIGSLRISKHAPHEVARPVELLLVPLPNYEAALNEVWRCPNEQPGSGA